MCITIMELMQMQCTKRSWLVSEINSDQQTKRWSSNGVYLMNRGTAVCPASVASCSSPTQNSQ